MNHFRSLLHKHWGSLLKCALTVLDQGLVSGTRFITAFLIARYSGAAELGTFSLAMSVFFLLASVEMALVSGPYSVFTHRYEGDEKRLLAGSATVHLLGFGSVASMLCILVGFGAGLFSADISWLSADTIADISGIGDISLLLAICLPLLLLRNFVRSFSLAHFDYSGLTLADIAADGILLAGLIYLIAADHLTAETALVAAALGGAASGAFWVFRYRQELKICVTNIKADFRKHLQFGKWMVGAEFIATAQGYLVLWILAASRSMTETGILAACMTIVNLANPIVLGLAGFFTPRLSRVFAKEGAMRLRRQSLIATAVIASVLLGFLGVFAAFGEGIISLVYADDIYSGQGTTLAVLSLGMLVASLAFGADTSLWIREQNNLIFWATAISFSMTLGAGVYLIDQMGVLGGALATLAGRIVFTVTCIAFEICFFPGNQAENLQPETS